jgi:threonine dehydrogenase-like Zn-dependent dehydrogenase
MIAAIAEDIAGGVVTVVGATIIGVCSSIARQDVGPEVIRAIREIPKRVVTITL